MSELNKCPFCYGSNFDAFTELEPPEIGRVRCRDCNASISGKTLPLAIEKWNSSYALVEARSLRLVCAEAYQLAGCVGAPVAALDNLSDAAHGQPLRHETFLPVTDEDCSAIRHLTEENAKLKDASERLRHVTDAIRNALSAIPGVDAKELADYTDDTGQWNALKGFRAYRVEREEAIAALTRERNEARGNRDLWKLAAEKEESLRTTLRAELETVKRELGESRIQEMRNYAKSPAMETFADLKHSQAGTVLAMLGDGAISRGKCCEVLAQLAHGVPFDEIPLPKENGRQFSLDGIPAEVVGKLEAELSALRTRLETAERVERIWLAKSAKPAAWLESMDSELFDALDHLDTSGAAMSATQPDAAKPVCPTCDGHRELAVNLKTDAKGNVIDYDTVPCPDCSAPQPATGQTAQEPKE